MHICICIPSARRVVMGCGCGKSTAAAPVVPVDAQQHTTVGPWTPRLLGHKKPSLAELRALNKPCPDELGGEKIAFGSDAAALSNLRSGASCLETLENNAVLVTIRVRPLNKREQDAGSLECLKQQGHTNIVLSREGEKDNQFAFDCVMGQDTRQRDVFDRTARPLLHKVLEGYNGCIFAYGQTGSGKTWTIQGESSGENEGVMPLLCKELFAEMELRCLVKTITVQCSVLEIYNERLRDLLVEKSEDLQIREDAAEGGRGIHVEGMSESSPQSPEDVLALIAKAPAKRAVGTTNMNDHSSRSHLVVTLRITCRDVTDEEGYSATVSNLHLVDLAGSERQKATGATGDRLKEGAQINLSLSALGNVINALTDRAKSRHIPYRDSKLTRLLQGSLGGNSYTVMICNVSPAQINAEETLSSLRFAERAKKIENVVTVNRDPKNAKIAELLEENKRLQAKCARLEEHINRLEAHYS